MKICHSLRSAQREGLLQLIRTDNSPQHALRTVSNHHCKETVYESVYDDVSDPWADRCCSDKKVPKANEFFGELLFVPQRLSGEKKCSGSALTLTQAQDQCTMLLARVSFIVFSLYFSVASPYLREM